MTRMHGRWISVLLIAVFLAAGLMKRGIPAERYADSVYAQGTVADVARLVSKSVVGVNNYQMDRLAATGSGVVIFDRYILTNYHVIEGFERISISVSGKEKETGATVCAYDAKMDAAVLYAKRLDVKPVPLGDSDQLQMGEWAICVGNPISEELRETVTTGIVSALDRAIVSLETTDRYGLKTAVVNKMIQTDAAINSGNSGGGLFNVLGQLIGIPTMKYTGDRLTGISVEGIGLAIPINSAKPLIQKAIGERLTDENLDMNF